MITAQSFDRAVEIQQEVVFFEEKIKIFRHIITWSKQSETMIISYPDKISKGEVNFHVEIFFNPDILQYWNKFCLDIIDYCNHKIKMYKEEFKSL